MSHSRYELMQFIKDYTTYQQWLSLVEMLYVLVVDKAPTGSAPRGMGDGGPTRYLVTCVVPIDGHLEAHEVTTGKRMPLTTSETGWTLGGGKVHCHLVKVNDTSTEQFSGTRLSRWSDIMNTYVRVPKNEAVALTDSDMLPALLEEKEIKTFKDLHMGIDGVIDRLNRAMPRYEESELGREAWHYTMNSRMYDRKDSGNEKEDPLNPQVPTRINTIFSATTVKPYSREDHNGLLHKMAMTYHIINKKGEKRLIPQWKMVDGQWEEANYTYKYSWELKHWILSRIHEYMFDDFELIPAYGVRVKPGQPTTVHYCKNCKRRTKHRVQKAYIYCSSKGCNFKVHKWIILFTFKAGCFTDPMPMEVPKVVKQAWIRGKDKTWSITVPFYPDWDNTKIKNINNSLKLLEV